MGNPAAPDRAGANAPAPGRAGAAGFGAGQIQQEQGDLWVPCGWHSRVSGCSLLWRGPRRNGGMNPPNLRNACFIAPARSADLPVEGPPGRCQSAQARWQGVIRWRGGREIRPRLTGQAHTRQPWGGQARLDLARAKSSEKRGAVRVAFAGVGVVPDFRQGEELEYPEACRRGLRRPEGWIWRWVQAGAFSGGWCVRARMLRFGAGSFA